MKCSITIVCLATMISICDCSTAMCKVAASRIEEGQTTAITCFFNVDLTEAAVNVHKITPEKRQVLLASYVWPANASQPKITVRLKGYRVQQLNGRRLMIVMDSASMDQTGGYQCQLLHDNNGERHNACHVEVKEKAPKTSCSVKPVPAGENTTLTCSFNKNILRGHKVYVLQKRSHHSDEFESVVDCSQDEGFGKFPICTSTVEGFHVIPHQTTTRSLLVHMFNVSKDTVGTYVCKIVSSVHPEKEDTCDFRLAVPAADDDNAELIGGISGGIVFVAALVLAGIMCYVLLKNSRLKATQPHLEKDEPPAEEYIPRESAASTPLSLRAPHSNQLVSHKSSSIMADSDSSASLLN